MQRWAGNDGRRGSTGRVAGTAVLLAALGCGPSGPVELPQALIDSSPIQYPVELWDLGMHGETMLMVHVTESGAIDSLYVSRSSGFPEFDSAAVQGARHLRFSPGRRGGRRADMWARMPVRFDRESGGAAGGTEAVGRGKP